MRYPPEFEQVLRQRFGADLRIEDFIPPVFIEMQGEILDYDPEERTLTARFPNEVRYQNPHAVMQGGIIAAAIDNAIGPLSFLSAPINLTREMTVKYKKAITEDFSYVVVKARVEKIDPPYLYLTARAESEDGLLFALAKAKHFILPEKA